MYNCTANIEFPPALPLCSLGEKYKQEGNKAYKSGDFLQARDLYSSAIKHDPQNATYYGNRSLTYMRLLDFHAALEDSTKSVDLDENYTKVTRTCSVVFIVCPLHFLWGINFMRACMKLDFPTPTKKILHLIPSATSFQGYLRIARCHLMLGNPSLSVEFICKALLVQPHHKQAKDEVRQLCSCRQHYDWGEHERAPCTLEFNCDFHYIYILCMYKRK